VLAKKSAVRAEEQDRAIERAAITLDDADDNVGVEIPCQRAEPIDRGSGDVDCGVEIAPEVVAARFRAPKSRPFG